MVDIARKHLGGPVHHMRFEDVEWQSEFDGIWAMASLLHVPRGELMGTIDRLASALVPGGVFYMSFKEGDGDRVKDGRIYTDFTGPALETFLRQSKRIETGQVWISDDFLSPTQGVLHARIPLYR